MPFRRIVVHGASEDRLQKLMTERLRPGADVDAIDERIWDLFGEEWCVMATDLSGFSRGVAKFGIIHFLQTIFESERILVPVVEKNDGILLKVEGDSFLVIFRNVQKALHASIEMQRTTRQYNANKPPEDHVLLGVGLGFGRVLRIADTEVFGLEVNAACILGETYAAGYDILVTKAVRDRAGDRYAFEPFEPAPPGAEAAFKVKYD
ncbi:MAG TPA: adenylate/guanylate cyclase domain-containing protein [Thermoanaerobaculia bacterium]|nr:adenylate/guanylate cyclase domain-containing protein [Thermoanaerobaculia bacterium]